MFPRLVLRVRFFLDLLFLFYFFVCLWLYLRANYSWIFLLRSTLAVWMRNKACWCWEVLFLAIFFFLFLAVFFNWWLSFSIMEDFIIFLDVKIFGIAISISPLLQVGDSKGTKFACKLSRRLFSLFRWRFDFNVYDWHLWSMHVRRLMVICFFFFFSFSIYCISTSCHQIVTVIF